MMNLIHNIPNLGEFTFICFLAACLELSFQEYIQHGMIFEHWGYFLESFSVKRGWKRKLAKFLGLCVYCNGFWVAVVVYILYFNDISLLILLFTGLNYVFLKIFSGLFNIIFKNS